MKAVGIILLLVVLVAVGVGVYLVTQSDALVKDGIETLGSEYLEADVTVDGVKISLADGSGTITGLQVGNPEGYEGPYAMRIEQVGLVLDTANLSSALVGIKRINVDGAKLAAVMKGVKNTNFRALLDNLERNLGPSEPEQPTESDEIRLIIDKFDFTAARATLDSDVLGSSELDIPDIHLTGIGRKESGVTAAEAVRQLLKPISEAIVRMAVQQRPEVKELEGKVKDKLDSVNKKLSEKLGGALKKLGRPQ